MFANSSKQLKITLYNNGSVVSSTLYSNAIVLDKYYNAKILISPTLMYLHINNELITYSLSAPPNLAANVYLVFNGTTTSSSNKFPGYLDEFHLKQGVDIPKSYLFNPINRQS
jgi:hypothetical protein